MKRTTIAAICIAGFIAGCEGAPAVVEHQPDPTFTLIAADADGPDFERVRAYATQKECEAEAFKMAGETTDTIPFCIIEGEL